MVIKVRESILVIYSRINIPDFLLPRSVCNIYFFVPEVSTVFINDTPITEET